MTYRWGLLVAILIGGSGGEELAQARRVTPVAVVVNEIMASNRATLADPQGEYDDWIELYNAGSVAVDLGGCYLTDDLRQPTKWQVPSGGSRSITIPSHGYLLIWADGDVADAGLHASFALNDKGEEVGLFAADGVTCIDSFAFGKQQPDASYGRIPDGGSELRAIVSPTPGAANAVLYEGIVAPPRIGVAGGVCTGPILVELATATDGAEIHYSLDGSDPLNPSTSTIANRSRSVPAMSNTYTAPLRIDKTTTLKVVATKPGWRPSAVGTARYIFLGLDLQTFSSPLPIAVIDTLGKAVSTAQSPAFGGFFDLRGQSGSRATFAGPADYFGPAAINIRGKSSGGYAKKQYHFETQDDRGNDKDVALLGFPAESDWVLQAMYCDKSLMRNVLAYEWSNELGQWATHTRFIELFLNADDSVVSMTDYLGVYVFMEKIKVGPNRVNIAKLGPDDNAEPEISGGYIIAKDKLDPENQTFTTSRGQSLIYADPSGPELTQPQKDWIRNYMNTFEAALYGAGFADPVNGYARYIDVDSFIDNHILIELTKNIDGFRLSTYWHKDRNGKLVMGPVWDYDRSLGNADYQDGWNATGWYYSLLAEGSYPYWRRLFEDPEFKLRYADRWFALRRDLFTTARLLGTIESYAALLDEPAARNYSRWPTLGVKVAPNWFIAKTYREEITWMEGWLANRVAWMDSQIALEHAPAPPVFNRQGGPVPAGFELTMIAPGPIYYTLDGSDPRAGAGLIGPSTSTALVPEEAAKRVLVPAGPVDDAWRGGSAFDDSAWTPAAGSVGFNQGSRAMRQSGLSVGSQMYGLQTSCYLRVPFTFTGDPAKLDSLTLRIRYNDGFVAYLNGVEIGRRNCLGLPLWNSAASAQVAAPGGDSEDIPVILTADVLRRGDNLLAIHGLNAAADSPDFAIAAELLANESSGLQTPARVRSYTAPIPLQEATQIRARALVGGRWSAINETVFTVQQ